MADLYRAEIHILLFVGEGEPAQREADNGEDNKSSPNESCGFHAHAPF